MKKYYIVSILLMGLHLHSQVAADAPQITRPTASYNGIANFNEIQVNTFTGVPDISIPLVGMPSRSKEVAVDVLLKYHPSGVSVYNGVSDVGMGWNLFGGGQITRKIIGKPDKYCVTGTDPLCSNQAANTDEYNYNFMGFGGRFKLVKDANSGVYYVQHMDLTPLKIEFTISTVDNSIASFIIYDLYGFQYVFAVKNILEDVFKQGTNNSSVEICSDTYQLTQVKDNNNNVLLSYEYQNFTFVGNSNNRFVNRTFNKLKKIVSPGFGSITFNFDFTSSYINGVNDPFQINEIFIKDSNEVTIKRVVMAYELVNYIVDRRMLTSVTFWDQGNTKNEVYGLNYTALLSKSMIECNQNYIYAFDTYGYVSVQNVGSLIYQYSGITSPDISTSGVLNEMILPTGGAIVYDFESNAYPFDSYLDEAAQDEELKKDAFNVYTHQYASYLYLSQGSTTKQLVVSGTQDKELHFKFWHSPYQSGFNPNPGQPLYPKYRIVGPNVDFQFGNSAGDIVSPQDCLGQYLRLAPGTYTIHIDAIFGAVELNGSIEVNERRLKPNLKRQNNGAGLRIKEIRHLESSNGGIIKERHFDYTKFDAPLQSSGELFDGDWERSLSNRKIGAQVGYTNVTTRNGLGNGFTQFSYLSKSPNLNFDAPNNNFRNLLSYQAGLLTKMELFDNDYKKLTSVENTYLFEHLGEFFWIPTSSSTTYNHATKLSWPKLKTKVTKNFTYDGATARQLKVEESYTYHDTNRELNEHTITNSLGETKKTKYYYHSGNSIHSKNRISAMEKVESYRDANLLVTSKTNYLTTFSGNASFLPESIEVAKENRPFEAKVRYQIYDSFGHCTQMQAENGLITSYLWGYNKSKPIAVINNASNADIASALGIGFGAINESHLIAINNLRGNPDFTTASITTYTHKLLVGVSTVTDARGDTIQYEYDTFGRLKHVIDQYGNILSENEYHYRTQN